MVRAMCGVQLKARKRSTNLMLILGLNETIDQLVMASCFHCYGHVLRRVDGHVLRRALDFNCEGQRKKCRQERTWKKQVEEESVKVGLTKGDVLCRSKWSVGVYQIAAGLRRIWPPSLVWGYYQILDIFFSLSKHWCYQNFVFLFYKIRLLHFSIIVQHSH